MAKKDQTETTDTKDSNKMVKARSLITGFWGGILFSMAGIFMYYFNFAETAPKTFLLRSWSTAIWTEGWLGDVISVVMTALISIIIAFIYYILLRRVRSMWIGIVYGVILWGIVFYMLHPIFPHVPSLMELKQHTIVSTLCLFILYGTFIGYSISFDHHDMCIRQNNDGKKTKKIPDC